MSISKGVVFTSFLWKFLERTSVQVSQFLITIILARLLLPSEYGIISLIMVFLSICQVVVDGGFNTALIQKKDTDNVDFSTIFYFCLSMAFVVYWLLFFSSTRIASFFNQPELIPVIRVLSLLLFFYAFNAIQYSYVAKNMLFRKLFYCSLISVLLSGCCGIFLAYEGFGVWALVAQILLNQLFLTILMFSVIKWRPVFHFSKQKLYKLLDYGWKIFTTNIVVSLFVNIRKVIIGKYFTPVSLAFFEKGSQFPDLIMGNINSSIQAIMFPVFSKEQDDRALVKKMVRRAIKTSCFAIYPLTMLLVVSAHPLILLLLTEKWLPVVPFLQILCLSNLFRPMTLINFEAIKALGYSNITLKLEIIKKIVDVVILVFSLLWGLYAIAWGVVLYDFICVFINLFPNKKLLDYGILDQLKDTIPIMLITISVGLIVYWIQFLNISVFFIISLQFFIGSLLYLSFCYIIKDESFMYVSKLLANFVTNKRK